MIQPMYDPRFAPADEAGYSDDRPVIGIAIESVVIASAGGLGR
jgi:hypothetical protein